MGNEKKLLQNVNVENKKVLVRVDFNVPLKNGVITDETRIKAALPTIEYLIKHQAKVILLSHLGRIKTVSDKDSKSLAVVAKALSKLLNHPVIFVPATRGSKLETAINKLKPGEVLLMENTRFEDLDGKKESGNDPELGKYWASLGDVFVNDAFGTAHRSHASNVGIATNIKTSCIGFLVEKELKMLNAALINPAHPYILVIGGAKVSDKIAVIDHMLTIADKILIAGGMAFTFLKAQGHAIGNSLIEPDKIELAKEYLAKAPDKLILPIDFAISDTFANTVPEYTTTVDIPAGKMGLDIGPKTIAYFKEMLTGAKTVVWNGPTGVFEFSNYAKGTLAICEAISELPDALTIIGGGDSAAAAVELGFKDKFSHISTGGGASLEYLEGKTLPGIAAIQDA